MYKGKEDHCLFCRHYITASGNCKGQELEPCGAYIDVDAVTLGDIINKILRSINYGRNY